jgi:hypothetical protein
VRRQVDERAIRASSASQAMTRKFAEWWLQRRHTFRYQIDGDYLRVWVSDDLDPSEIELDQCSAGMQYFFSFFLVFLVEAEDAHVNSILLLDEPGTSLHGTAQAKIVEFLRKISKDNQVIYTSHSPFMIDAEHLETVRPVHEDPVSGSTQISEDVLPKDKDALFPLQAALGYQLVQALFISKRQAAVEGITDYWIFKALDHAARSTGRDGLHSSVIITPSGGASRMIPLASMLVGHQVDLVAVLDGDEPGRREGARRRLHPGQQHERGDRGPVPRPLLPGRSEARLRRHRPALQRRREADPEHHRAARRGVRAQGPRRFREVEGRPCPRRSDRGRPQGSSAGDARRRQPNLQEDQRLARHLTCRSGRSPSPSSR